MAFIFLPGKRWSESDVGGGGYPHVSMESELPDIQRRIRRKRRCVGLGLGMALGSGRPDKSRVSGLTVLRPGLGEDQGQRPTPNRKCGCV